ncbi:hypothetical protein HMPREF1212_04037 [Parabacteroides sp. HGS0025]|uniref:LacI family DNA-binding transcriptional regulator n=1 Tax=Parabacteroides sp. HGS0025 TaxID=1078087 RepID=UPI00061719BB|nr:LacI family DNA-binding transcriptional regulator [Parabacteroides sp. HGS0025]KKB46542.1 hypothetical protein HMPREF1212_04037 [Parabacteroides sp. HGS0025]
MARKRHISLKDLANELGVSVSTVSRALNDSYEISPEMRERVKALAEQWNYRPNPFALSLLKNTPRIIGIIVPDLVTHFYSSIISGINDVARQNGYSVIITSSYEQYEQELHCVEDLVNMRVEGILACLSQETIDYSHFLSLSDMDIPLVFFDRVCMPNAIPSVVADNMESALVATKHLLQTGSKRVSFLGGSDHLEIVRQRKAGYLAALAELGIPVEEELIICEKMTYSEGREGCSRLLSLPAPPDAILAMNDTLAFAAMKEIKKHGLRIPSDISLIGYTDELHSNYVEPALTAVTHQTYKMGEECCCLLLKQIKKREKPRQIVVPTHLSVRESSIK